MLVQLRDHDLLDAGFDDDEGLSRPMSDDSDDADLRYVERNLENDFGYDNRIANERAMLRVTRRVIYARDYETEDERRRRRLAHARWLLAILEEHHGFSASLDRRRHRRGRSLVIARGTIGRS